MQEQWEGQFEGDARRATQAVVDLDSEERQCPACCATFRAGPLKCPECGLFIGG